MFVFNLADRMLKACVLLQSHLDSYKVAANSTEKDFLDLTHRSLDIFVDKLKEKRTLLLRRNLTRAASVVASLKSFTEEQIEFVHKCLQKDEYYTEVLLTEDDQSVLLVSTCLNYQLLLRRTENLSKTIAWHMKRRDTEHCCAGLLQLLMRCFETVDESANSANECHNLVDICLGPIESSSSGALFHIEKLLKVTQQLQAIYDPILQLRIVNNSINAITIEKIQSIVEDCEVLGDGVDASIGLLEQASQNMPTYASAVKGIQIDTASVGAELEDTVDSLRSHLAKARAYMERIEEVAKMVESKVCMPYKKQTWNTSDIRESVDDHLGNGDGEWGDDPSCQCKVEAIRDISSAYKAAQCPSRRYFNVLLHGSGYEVDLPEGPLLVVELKSVPRIYQTPAPTTALDCETHFAQSNEIDQTEASSQWLEWSTESTSGLKRISSFTFFSLGLAFTM
ncbi:hypothetical protein TcWFU_004265 [Taenia crassiceps]|uniref:Uncharacterized protein n=1 Tax=Taenia crassiceps TaxID=6207 RepID=A0ABR4QD07_9CEST